MTPALLAECGRYNKDLMKKRYWITSAAAVAGVAVAAKLLKRPDDVDWGQNRDTIFHADHSHFVEIDGIRIHYQEAGQASAPPVILIHGFASSTLVWSNVFLHLANAGFRVIALDLPGYGYSGKPRYGEYTISAQARAITRLLDRLGIGTASIVGSSYGGAVAAVCALDYPERVNRLILVGAVINNEPLNFTLMKVFGSPVIGDVISPLLLSSRRLLKRRMKRVYDKHACVLDERRVDARHLPLRTVGTQRAIVRTVRRWDASRIERDASLIDHPTLLVWGENDVDVPLKNGKWLNHQITGSRLIIFKDCGHLPHEECPRGFVKVVKEFLGQRLPQTLA